MPQHIVVIGAVALGPKAACRLKRLDPAAEVTMLDQDSRVSYGGCGIPYYVSGEVSDVSGLRTTSFNMVRDERFFREAKDIDVQPRTSALAIDRDKKQVLVQHLDTGALRVLAYDKLVLATGSRPRKLDVPGADLPGVYTVSGLDEAEAIRERVSTGKVSNAVVIGGGFIGLEMAVALTDMWGIETTVLDIAPTILPGMLGTNMARMAQHHMEEKGVTFHLGESILRLEASTSGGTGEVAKIVTDKRELPADLVIVSIGVIPNSELAADAGLALSPKGAVVVDKAMRTSDPDIFAGGNLVEVENLVTGKPAYFPLGSMANRQGRVIGTNLAGAGEDATFDGAVGTFAVKLFELSVAGTGLTAESARRAGFDAVGVHVVQFDRAHFYPDKDLMSLDLVVERGTGRVLGLQGIGADLGVIGRIDAVAALLTSKRAAAHVSDVSNLEVAYSPPFSSAMDILNAVGNVAENTLAGRNRTVGVDGFCQLWDNRDQGDTLFLDCRGWGNAEPYAAKYPEHWKSVPQDELRERLAEVPRDKKLVLICNTGVRSYEAQRYLDECGITDTLNVEGGMAAIKKWGLEL